MADSQSRYLPGGIPPGNSSQGLCRSLRLADARGGVAELRLLRHAARVPPADQDNEGGANAAQPRTSRCLGPQPAVALNWGDAQVVLDGQKLWGVEIEHDRHSSGLVVIRLMTRSRLRLRPLGHHTANPRNHP